MSGNIKDKNQIDFFESITFKNEDASIYIDINFDKQHGTIWATQEQMAKLYSCSVDIINKLIDNIYKSHELDPYATLSKIAIDRNKGNKIVHYNLDMIISVGYRISSNKATEFRKWAMGIIKSYIENGYVLNESRLRNDPDKLNKLAEKIRELRADEKNIYKSVRDVYAIAAKDYDKNSPLVRSFYAKLQDKFLVATTGKTASQIKLERADHTQPNMGLTNMRGDKPCSSDIHIGKNYLYKNEFYYLHILCEQFLLFMQSKAIHGKQLTMEELNQKFDQLLEVQGHEIFNNYDKFLANAAKSHAKNELLLWKKNNKIK